MKEGEKPASALDYLLNPNMIGGALFAGVLVANAQRVQSALTSITFLPSVVSVNINSLTHDFKLALNYDFLLFSLSPRVTGSEYSKV